MPSLLNLTSQTATVSKLVFLSIKNLRRCPTTPYPTTPLYQEAFDEGLIPADYWKDFIQGKTSARIPYLVSDAEQRGKTAYQRFYFRPKFMLRRMFNSFKNFTYIKNGFKAIIALIYYRFPTSITPGVTRKSRSSEILPIQDIPLTSGAKVSLDTAALQINRAQKKRGEYIKLKNKEAVVQKEKSEVVNV